MSTSFFPIAPLPTFTRQAILINRTTDIQQPVLDRQILMLQTTSINTFPCCRSHYPIGHLTVRVAQRARLLSDCVTDLRGKAGPAGSGIALRASWLG